MKYVRFRHGDAVAFGALDDDASIVHVCAGDMFRNPSATGESVVLSPGALVPPCAPSKMVALWNNSKIQIQEKKRETPKEVLYFLKPANSFLTHGQAIVYPAQETERVVLEGELGIVIGQTCRRVSKSQSGDCIFGYTVINDVTAQDIVQRDSSYPQYVRAKGFDTFGVFGPAIVTDVDPMTLRIRSYVNGRLCQDYPVTDLVFNPYEIVADISRSMTLCPGDVIACGTSLGVEPIRPGDTVEIRIDGIGSLVNDVV